MGLLILKAIFVKKKSNNKRCSMVFWLKNIKSKLLAKYSLEKWLLYFIILRIPDVQFMNSNYKISLNTTIPIYLEANYSVLLTHTLY